MKTLPLLLVVCVFLSDGISPERLVANDRPNILVLLADDLGYADLGCYGGEIDTPNLDRLATEGLQFTHFRATPMCVTSRVALMAGMPYNAAGRQSYKHATPLPIALRELGYRRMMVGKWHAGEPNPKSTRVFDRSFGFLGGATDSFVGGNDWFLDRQPFRDFSSDFYATTAFANRSITFMQEAVRNEQPFFMYVAFNAPHHPCQAPQATVEKYTKRYLAGYEAMRAQRHSRQIRRGIVDPAWSMAPLDQTVKRWDELSPARQQVEAKRMAAYAAAVDEVDQSVGRILTHLEDAGLAGNTLVVFLSDNGGDYGNGNPLTDLLQVPWKSGSNPSSSNGWASVKCTPFRHFKHSCHEGGLAVPFIVRWPNGIAKPTQQFEKQPASIFDLYPTFLEVASSSGKTNPLENRTNANRPLTGSSLLPIFAGEQRAPKPALFSWYNFSKAWTENGWKAVSLYGGPWQLFDLTTDRGEAVDLAASDTDRLTAFVEKWNAFAQTSDIPQDRPASTFQESWGWHRIQMVAPSLVELSPANGCVCPSVTSIELKFRQPVDFTKSNQRTIRLYDVSNEQTPIWSASVNEQHLAQGKRVIRFNDIPALKSDTQYAFRWDAGWVSVGGRPLGPLNDGAYWWRFRTE